MAVKPTFACVLRSGGDYFPEHVQALARQVEQHTTVDYEFVCYSDTPIHGVKTVPLLGDAPGWWAVPEVFRQTGPTVITGIDTMVVANIDQIFKLALDCKPEDFWMIRAFNPRNDYASGIMVYNGDWSVIWREFDYQEAIKQHGGEQDHTKNVLKKLGVTPKVLQKVIPGIVSYKKHCTKGVPPDATIILFHGKPRPWEVKNLWATGEYGKIEKIWPDSTVFILGGGPSLNDMRLELLQGHNVLGVNQAYKITDCEVQVNYSGDRRWYYWNIDKLPNYKGILYTSYRQFLPDPRCPAININRMSGNGISDRSPSAICWNGNSGASAVNVAYWLGAKRIVLLGFDMGRQHRKWNWHDDYKKYPEVDIESGRARSPYRHFLRSWNSIAVDAKRLGVEILNATPSGNLHKFPRVKLEDVT